jgi:RNA polymerase sigma-70 factor, ECF subfamily
MISEDNRGPNDLAEPTIVIIRRIQSGDISAKEDLIRRLQPLLRRWAHGRLPSDIRDLNETEDLVQVALVRSLAQIDQFRSELPGAFFAYLRHSLLNLIRDEIRRHQRRPDHGEIDVELVDVQAVPMLDKIVGAEQLRAYENALATLSKRQQNLVVMRLEFGMSYSEIAAEVGSTPDAVRVMISRAIVDLSKRLKSLE